MMLLQFIVLQVIVFGVVIFFLKKVFHGDTTSAIQRLGNAQETLLQQQMELQKKNEEMEKAIASRKQEADQLVDKLKLEAVAELQKKEDVVLKAARAEAETIISKAQGALEEMEKEIESKVSKKVIQFAAELFKSAFHEKLVSTIHDQMVADFILKAKDADFSSVGESSEFVVRTSVPLKREQADKINAMLAEKLNRVVKFNELMDTDLIAGIVLQFGSLVLDGSLASRLKDAAAHMQEKY